MFDKIKQLKELRDQAQHLKELLSQQQVSATAESGRVKIVMNGNQEILSIDIDDGLMTPAEKTRLESALREAYADALRQVHRVMAETMRQHGSLSLPGM